MERASLIERITDLVVQELRRREAGTAPASPPPPRRRLLVCPAPGVPAAREEPVWQALRSAGGEVEWWALEWPGYPGERLARALAGQPIRVVQPPACWEEMVTRVEAVLLPFLPLALLARLALLLADHPPVAAAVAGLIQGVPVLAGSSEVDRLTRHSARLPAGLLRVVRQHVGTLQDMGVRLVDSAGLAEAAAGGVKAGHPGRSRGRDVLTQEDLLAAVRSGVGAVEVAPGTIVTPLAQETARRLGIEVRYR